MFLLSTAADIRALVHPDAAAVTATDHRRPPPCLPTIRSSESTTTWAPSTLAVTATGLYQWHRSCNGQLEQQETQEQAPCSQQRTPCSQQRGECSCLQQRGPTAAATATVAETWTYCLQQQRQQQIFREHHHMGPAFNYNGIAAVVVSQSSRSPNVMHSSRRHARNAAGALQRSWGRRARSGGRRACGSERPCPLLRAPCLQQRAPMPAAAGAHVRSSKQNGP